jgi:V/A-type H+-transporting ATPase subunit C
VEKLVKFKDTDFLHASARIRSVSKKLLTNRQILQMAETPSLEEAWKLCNDAGIGATTPAEDFERALSENLDEAYELLESLVEGHDFLRLLRYEYDALNLKILIKAKAMNSDCEGMLTSLGSIPAGVIAAEFKGGVYEKTPPRLARAAAEAEDALARTGDPQLVDVILDKAMLAAMNEKAQGYDIPILHRIVRERIDLENIKAAVRLSRIGKDLDFLKRLLSPGGAVDPAAISAAFPQGMNAIVDMIEATPYGERLAPSLQPLRDGGSLTEFERLCDNLRLDILSGTKFIPFGVEVLVVYALAKDMELRAVRIVLASRLAGVNPGLIRERLRETYA